MKKRFLAFSLAVVFSLTFMPIGDRVVPAIAEAISNSYFDYSHYQNSKWADIGIVPRSSEDFRPDEAITRGEFSFWLDKLMNYQVKSENIYNDVANNAYADSLLKAHHAGIIANDGNNLMPNGTINRQDVVYLLAKAFDVDSTSTETGFSDDSSIAPYAKQAVASFKNKGYIRSYVDGSFKPREPMTRADALNVLDSMVKEIVSTSLSKSVDGIVVVNKPNVSLLGMTVNGSIIVSEGAQAGPVSIKGVRTTGEVVVRGGGASGITLDGSTINAVVVDNHDGAVKVATTNNSVINSTIIKNGKNNVALEGNFGTIDIKDSVSVNLRNNSSSSVSLSASNGKVNVENGSNISVFNVLQDSLGSTISNSGNINTLNVVASRVTVDGNGTIPKANVSGSYVYYNVLNSYLTVANNVIGTNVFSNPVNGGTQGTTSSTGFSNYTYNTNNSSNATVTNPPIYAPNNGVSTGLYYDRAARKYYYYDNSGHMVYVDSRYGYYNPYDDLAYYNPWGISVDRVKAVDSRNLEVYMPYSSDLTFWVGDTSSYDGAYYNDYTYDYAPQGYYRGDYNIVDRYGNYVYFYRDGYYGPDGRIITYRDGFYDKYGNLLTLKDNDYFGYYDRSGSFIYSNDGIYDRYGKYIYGRYGYYDGDTYVNVNGNLEKYVYYDGYGRHYYNDDYRYNYDYKYSSKYLMGYNNNTVSSAYYNSSKGCYEIKLNFDLSTNKNYNLFINRDGYVVSGTSFSWDGDNYVNNERLDVYATNSSQTVVSGAAINEVKITAPYSYGSVNYSVDSSLPRGLSLNVYNNHATVNGSITSAGAYRSVIRATDSRGNSGSVSLYFDVR